MKSIRGAAFTIVSIALMSSAALAARAVTLAPASGGPAATTTVKLTGFAAGKTVDVYFDTTDTCVIVTSSTGRGSCTVTIPADAQPRKHWFSAVERITGNGAQKPFLVRINWPQFHGATAAHDGFNRLENTIGVNNAGKLDLKWTAVPVVSFSGTPVVANGRIYAAGADNKLYAFDAIKGTAVPGFPRTIGPALTFQSPVFANGNIYVASQGAGIGKLYAFNGATGAPIAGFPKAVGDGPHGPMAATGNNIYVSGSAGKIFGFNALTGATLAGFPIAVPGTPNIYGGVTAVNGKLLFGADDHNLYSYNAATGALIGAATLGGTFNYSTPSASGGTVYAAPTNANHLSNFTEGANLLWDSPFISLGNQGGAPAIAYGRVFLSDGSGKAYAFDTATGALKWSTVLGAAAEGSVLVANGVAYASTAFKLFALDAATGAILWSHQNYAKYGQSPVVANGMVYAASGVGGLRAFSINGLAPAAPEAGGELGVRPSLSRLKPDISLKPQAQ